MPSLASLERFRDYDDLDHESCTPSNYTSEETSAVKSVPSWYWRYNSPEAQNWGSFVKIREFGSRSPSPTGKPRRKAWVRRLLIVFGIMSSMGATAWVTYICLAAALIRRLDPPRINTGLQHIVDNWKEPDRNGAYTFEWSDDFSRGVVPKNCHSHNDYWRSVPMYEAFAAGCVGIEADIWLMEDGELRVSHSWGSIHAYRTLRSLYLDPLSNIFTNRNVSVASTNERKVGIFDVDPNVSVVLLIDFKNDGHKIWPVLMKQLQPLREKGWLTHFDGTRVVQGPLTIVGTGDVPFELVQGMDADRFVFFDAPLNDISNSEYTSENSYYASIAMRKAVGRILFNRLSARQVNILRSQIRAASDKGLVSRYWSTPSWPISLRQKVWFTLVENNVGVLNVDDLYSATRWNWNWCVIAGLTLCGSG